MILMGIFALICALSTIIILTPIAQTHRRQSIALMIFIPCIALGLYMGLGAPDVPSQPAIYETDPEIIDARNVVLRELETMQAISKDPNNTTLIMRLAGLRMKQGKFDDAAQLLHYAVKSFPDEPMLKMQLATAYFAKAMTLLENKRFVESYQAFEKVKHYAPADAPMLEDVNAIMPELKKLL